MEIEHLREFVELSRRLNFTATARYLNMSQPALSNHVADLERTVGTPLLERSRSQGTRLTQAGQRFLEMAQEIIRAYDDAMEDIDGIRRARNATIRFRTPRHEYSDPLVRYVHEFERQHPDVEVVWMPWVVDDGFSDVESGKVDCAFVGYDCDMATAGRDIVMVPYATTPLYVWLDVGDPLAACDEVPVAALDGRTFAIPANQKHRSWSALMRSVAQLMGIEIHVVEKYCGSLEDFVLNRIERAELVVNTQSLYGMASSMTKSRVVKKVGDGFEMPLAIACNVAGGNGVMLEFIEHMTSAFGEKDGDEGEGRS